MTVLSSLPKEPPTPSPRRHAEYEPEDPADHSADQGTNSREEHRTEEIALAGDAPVEVNRVQEDLTHRANKAGYELPVVKLPAGGSA